MTARAVTELQGLCSHLVGSYALVALELSRYVTLGARVLILGIPPSREELQHVRVVFGLAAGAAAARAAPLLPAR